MDEYQTLAVAAVEALQLATQPKWTEIAAIVVGIAQCALIAWGIQTMGRSAELRDQAHERRHEETMIALRTLIEQGDESRQALRVLIERSA